MNIANRKIMKKLLLIVMILRSNNFLRPHTYLYLAVLADSHEGKKNNIKIIFCGNTSIIYGSNTLLVTRRM